MRRIIDSHLHLWDINRFSYPWLGDPGAEDLAWDYLAEHWAVDAAGLDIAATVHVQAELDHALDPVIETAWLAESAAGDHRVPTVAIGYADLRSTDLAETLDRHAAHPLFRGVRQEAWFDPDSRRADVPRENLLDDPSWARGLRELARRELSFDLLVWHTQLAQATALFRQHEDVPLILEHVGLPVDPSPEARATWRSGLQQFAADLPRAVLKISALRFISPTWSFEELRPVVREAIEIFGPTRCMFGSNFPVDKPSVSYADVWAAFGNMVGDLTSYEQDELFWRTAARTYRIDIAEG